MLLNSQKCFIKTAQDLHKSLEGPSKKNCHAVLTSKTKLICSFRFYHWGKYQTKIICLSRNFNKRESGSTDKCNFKNPGFIKKRFFLIWKPVRRKKDRYRHLPQVLLKNSFWQKLDAGSVILDGDGNQS